MCLKNIIWEIGAQMIDKFGENTVLKVKKMLETYSKYAYVILDSLATEYHIPNKPRNSVPPASESWNTAEKGMIWGENELAYAWFRSFYTVPAEYDGKTLYLLPKTGAAEALFFINGRPSGLFDSISEVCKPEERLHLVQPLTLRAKAGEGFEIALEAYGGRTLKGFAPMVEFSNDFYPLERRRRFEGIFIAEKNEVIGSFLLKLRTVVQLYENLEDNNRVKWDAYNLLCDIFRIVPQIPEETDFEIWNSAVLEAERLLCGFISDNSGETQFGEYGIIGHSHLDTAWLWTVEECKHKAARTFSNALSLMDRYDEYIFMQSSVLYLYWMEKYYPDIYAGISERIAEGRWEPNGGSWVECDGNITGGEYLIRQFIRGQNYLKEHFGYRADCFWQPDTFGYSPAIPQIMKGCGLKYFYTTKLSWNECNTFPYDTFYWQGIDGSRVLTHFNLTHCWPDAEALLKAPLLSKEVTDSKLLAYGFGDGGGGPNADMLETARITENLKCLPHTKHTTVSDFMKRLEKTAVNAPVYDGELYLELHRGTLTQMHDIKQSNRQAEIALHNLETVSCHSNIEAGNSSAAIFTDLTDVLLLNQFHDILPGTSIKEAGDLAVKQNRQVIEEADKQARLLCAGTEQSEISVYNTLSFSRDDAFTLDGIKYIKNAVCQHYKDFDGKDKTVVSGVELKPFSAVNLRLADAKSQNTDTVFFADGNKLETPYYRVCFTENGEILSLTDKRCNRETASGYMPLNTFCYGEDVPLIWDNWNIDYDQKKKMTGRAVLENREIASSGAVEHRIRCTYSFGKSSRIIQDTVFYADSPRIDFETSIDWQEKHTLLKAMFPLNIHTHFARFETQFGYTERANNENTLYEKAKFEVCNHKWTDLSENRYGISLLNDCKYGISVYGNVLGLSLHRGGCSPDERGDFGVHSFTYSLLPHMGSFGSDTVREGYRLNYAPIISIGGSRLTEPMFTVDASNAVIETVKAAEDGDGYIIRLYETECSETAVKIKAGFDFKKASETNMLEEPLGELKAEEGTVTLRIKPFEIKTLRFVL